MNQMCKIPLCSIGTFRGQVIKGFGNSFHRNLWCLVVSRQASACVLKILTQELYSSLGFRVQGLKFPAPEEQHVSSTKQGRINLQLAPEERYVCLHLLTVRNKPILYFSFCSTRTFCGQILSEPVVLVPQERFVLYILKTNGRFNLAKCNFTSRSYGTRLFADIFSTTKKTSRI